MGTIIETRIESLKIQLIDLNRDYKDSETDPTKAHLIAMKITDLIGELETLNDLIKKAKGVSK